MLSAAHAHVTAYGVAGETHQLWGTSWFSSH